MPNGISQYQGRSGFRNESAVGANYIAFFLLAFLAFFFFFAMASSFRVRVDQRQGSTRAWDLNFLCPVALTMESMP
jgi:hypothetical protein